MAGKACAVRENINISPKSITLANIAIDREIGALQRPVQAIGYARGVFPPVVAGEAVEREQVAVFEIDRAGILIGNVEIGGRRRQHDLDAGGELLLSAQERTDERPLHISRQSTNGPRVPA